jgi:hypothetical protein
VSNDKNILRKLQRSVRDGGRSVGKQFEESSLKKTLAKASVEAHRTVTNTYRDLGADSVVNRMPLGMVRGVPDSLKNRGRTLRPLYAAGELAALSGHHLGRAQFPLRARCGLSARNSNHRFFDFGRCDYTASVGLASRLIRVYQ